MCYNCDKSKREDVGYKVVYRCKDNDNEVSEIVDTYFNERYNPIDCPEGYFRNTVE